MIARFLHDAAGFKHELINSVQLTVIISCLGAITSAFWAIRSE